MLRRLGARLRGRIPMPPGAARNYRNLLQFAAVAQAKKAAADARVADFVRTVAIVHGVPDGWTFDAERLEYRRTKRKA